MLPSGPFAHGLEVSGLYIDGLMCLESEARTGALETRVDDMNDWVQKTRQRPKPPNLNTLTTTADFNRDGRTDIAVVFDDGSLNAFYVNDNGNLEYGRPLWRWDGNWGSNKRIVAGDYNGDGVSDIAVSPATGP